MRRRKGSAIRRIIGVTIVVAILVEAWVIFAPRIDERLNYLTRRSLNAVQYFRTSGRTVRDAVNARYRNARWTAYHRDYLTETYVRCDALDVGGGTSRDGLDRDLAF